MVSSPRNAILGIFGHTPLPCSATNPTCVYECGLEMYEAVTLEWTPFRTLWTTPISAHSGLSQLPTHLRRAGLGAPSRWEVAAAAGGRAGRAVIALLMAEQAVVAVAHHYFTSLDISRPCRVLHADWSTHSSVAR